MKTTLAFADDDSSDSSESIKKFQNKLNRFKKSFVIFDQIIDLHQWLDHRFTTKTCGIVSGHSGAGKTTACRLYVYQKNKSTAGKTDSNSANSPVLYIQMHPNFSPSMLFASITKALSLTASSNKLAHLQDKTISSLKAAKIQLIILDGAEFLSSQVAPFIHDLIEQAEVSIVLVGGNCLERLVRANEFLNRHFFCHHNFLTLSSEQVKSFLETWASNFEMTLSFQDSSIRRLLKASEGSVRKLMVILMEVTLLAISEEGNTINEPILVRVLKQFNYYSQGSQDMSS